MKGVILITRLPVLLHTITRKGLSKFLMKYGRSLRPTKCACPPGLRRGYQGSGPRNTQQGATEAQLRRMHAKAEAAGREVGPAREPAQKQVEHKPGRKWGVS